MNALSRVSSYATTLLGREARFLYSRSFCPKILTLSCKRSFEQYGLKSANFQFLLTRFHARCCSSRRVSGKSSRKKKPIPEPVVVEKRKDDFFVIRKGDVVGVYKRLDDCQAQAGSSVSDPPVSIFKGNSLSMATKEYLISRGIHNALFAIRVEDLKEDLFGSLVPCTFEEADGSTSDFTDHLRKHMKLDNHAEIHSFSDDHDSCVLEFDGASKGNPGQAGAGAVLWKADGSPICRLRKGLGQRTNNVAEYEAMILGLEHALKKGYTKIRVIGDSKLVCSQLQGLWRVRHPMMATLYEQAKSLKNKFVSFQINHVLREINVEADVQANLAVKLADGQVEEELCI